MPGSPQPTELSNPLISTSNEVIEFHSAPTYRGCTVSLKNSSKVEFFGIVNYKGQSRAVVANLIQTSKRCRVSLVGCNYTIHHSYSGYDVSSGVREI